MPALRGDTAPRTGAVPPLHGYGVVIWNSIS